MITIDQCPRHKFTAETMLRIEALHRAAARLRERYGKHVAEGNYKRSDISSKAAFRLQYRAFATAMNALTPDELHRLCEIQAKQSLKEKQKAAA